MSVVVSFSRGGFVGLVAVFFVVWLLSKNKIISLVLVAVISLGLYFYAGQDYIQEMSTVTDTEDSTADARLKSWASAWDMFIDNPLGVGGNNFQVRFPEYQQDRFSRGMYGRVAHSLWFTLIPELGIIGIILYFRLLKYNINDISKLKKLSGGDSQDEKYLHAMSISFIASMAGYFASGSFISVLYYPHYWYLTAVIVASIRIQMMLGDSKAAESKTHRRLI